ncbi:unnamed protein product, partial [Didymodactylos carnosus]
MNNDDKTAIQHFVDYIRIKTVQPDPDYDKAFEFLKSYANELNLTYQKVQVTENRHVAILTWISETASSTEKSILLNSHIDVVPVFPDNWSCDPFD